MLFIILFFPFSLIAPTIIMHVATVTYCTSCSWEIGITPIYSHIENRTCNKGALPNS